MSPKDGLFCCSLDCVSSKAFDLFDGEDDLGDKFNISLLFGFCYPKWCWSALAYMCISLKINVFQMYKDDNIIDEIKISSRK